MGLGTLPDRENSIDLTSLKAQWYKPFSARGSGSLLVSDYNLKWLDGRKMAAFFLGVIRMSGKQVEIA